MSKKSISINKVVPRKTRSGHCVKSKELKILEKLIAEGSRAASLGIAVLDSQTRFETVNASLARETQAVADYHIGRTSREVVGGLADQIEPTYENVLRTGKQASVLLKGRVRDTPEYGYWYDHCFPIVDHLGEVRQLGLFVVNVTAEKASAEIIEALGHDPKRQMAEATGLLSKLRLALTSYHRSMKLTFEQLASPFVEPARKAAAFQSSIRRLDEDVREMRDLVYAVISQFSIPAC
jgi:hypothetical protein